jgi:WD40 repeat protein
MAVAFSPGGRRIASAVRRIDSSGGNETVKVWDTESGQLLLRLNGYARFARDVTFSPDGQRIASVGDDERTIKVWDSVSGREMLTLKGYSLGADRVSFSPDGRCIASSGDLGTIRIWDARDK